MTLKQHTCYSVVCNECGDPYNGYEDEFTVHFGSPDEFVDTMKDYEGEENEWRIDGDKHYCPSCACKRETDHALTEEIGSRRFCRCGSNWDGKRAVS